MPEEFEDFVEGPGADFANVLAAPVDAVRDLVLGLKVGLGNPNQVESVFGVVNGIELPTLFVSDLQGFAVKIDTLQQELIVVFSEVEVHLGDSLVFCAEKKPKLISGDVGRYLQSFP